MVCMGASKGLLTGRVGREFVRALMPGRMPGLYNTCLYPCGSYHMECLTPPLDTVPVEEWFCPECAANNRNQGK